MKSRITQAEADAAFAAVRHRLDETVPSMMRRYITDEMIFDVILLGLEAAYPHRPAKVTPATMSPAERKPNERS